MCCEVFGLIIKMLIRVMEEPAIFYVFDKI